MKLFVKFRENIPQSERERVLARFRKQGAQAVEPLFPDVEDEELSSVFVIDTSDRAAKKLLGRLKDNDAIEYAETEVRRKLIS